MVAGLAEQASGKSEFEGRVYTKDGVTFAQTSRGGVQVIATEGEDGEEPLPADARKSEYRLKNTKKQGNYLKLVTSKVLILYFLL